MAANKTPKIVKIGERYGDALYQVTGTDIVLLKQTFDLPIRSSHYVVWYNFRRIGVADRLADVRAWLRDPSGNGLDRQRDSDASYQEQEAIARAALEA